MKIVIKSTNKEEIELIAKAYAFSLSTDGKQEMANYIDSALERMDVCFQESVNAILIDNKFGKNIAFIDFNQPI